MRKYLAISAVILFILYLSPQVIRNATWGDNLIGFTTYYHVRMAEQISSGEWYDPLSFGGRPYTYPPGFHVMLSSAPDLSEFVIPIFGAFGIIICFYLGKELKLSDKEALFAAIILGLIPGFIYLSSHVNPRLPALVALALGFLFILRSRRNHIYQYLAALPLFFILIVHPLDGLIGLVFGAILFHKHGRRLVVPYTIAIVLFSLWFIPSISQHGLPQAVSFYGEYVELKTGIQYFIYETGTSADSIGIVVLLLAIFACMRVKNPEEKFLFLWFWIAIFIALVFGNRLNELVIFPAAMLAAIAFSRHWRGFLKAIKFPRIVPQSAWTKLFVFYIIFSAVWTSVNFAHAYPYPEDYTAMEYLRDNSPPDAVVLASWELGHWITGIAQRKNIIDAYVEYAPADPDVIYKDIRVVLYGADLDRTLASLSKYNVSYVYTRFDALDICAGFAYLTRYPYFEKLYVQKGQKYYSVVYRVDYTGSATPYNICALTE